MRHIAIADYGLGNLHSVRRAFEAAGATATITTEPADLSDADAVVVPGVGAFGQGMKNLEARGLAEQIKGLAKTGMPTLGICLGMQLLMDESEELGHWQGLGLIPGRVIGFSPPAGERAKVPQIGWNSVEPPVKAESGTWSSRLLHGIEAGAYMYFVHSFAVLPKHAGDLIAETQYAGLRFCSVLANANVYGCQFHPEKSGKAGLQLIENFLSIVRER